MQNKENKSKKKKWPAADQDFIFFSFKLTFTVCPAYLNETLGRRFDTMQTSLAGGFPPRRRVSPGGLGAPARAAPWELVGAPATCKTATATRNIFFFHGENFVPCLSAGTFICRGGMRSLLLPRHLPPPKGAVPGRSIPRRWGLPGGKALILHRSARGRAASGPAAFPCAALGGLGRFSTSPADVAPRSFQAIPWFCNT